MAEPMTEEELTDLRARVERVPLCYQREADTTIARLLATVNERRGRRQPLNGSDLGAVHVPALSQVAGPAPERVR